MLFKVAVQPLLAAAGKTVMDLKDVAVCAAASNGNCTVKPCFRFGHCCADAFQRNDHLNPTRCRQPLDSCAAFRIGKGPRGTAYLIAINCC